MRFGRWHHLLLALVLLGSLALSAAHAGPLAVITNFREGFLPSTVTILDTSTDQPVATIPVGVNPAGVAITPDGKTAVVACAESQDLWFIDLTTRPPRLAGSLPVGGGLEGPFFPVGVSISPDGEYAAVTVGINTTAAPRAAPGNQYVRVVSIRERRIVQSIRMPQDQFPITAEATAISSRGSIVILGPSTNLIYALAFSEGQIALPEGTNDQLGAFQGAGGTHVVITPDGGTALVPLARRKLQVFNIDGAGRLSPTIQLDSGGDGAQSVALTTDGRRAFVRNFFAPGNNVSIFDMGPGGAVRDTGLRLK
ncbi:MAG: YncE family protein, partial [Chloroflexi bacterium]|nr:YncE family protein [Chloroflexota bacterium]